MAETDLQNYKLQLQQVEVALLSDPDNDELKKLKIDLEEVIDLTKELIKAQVEEQKRSYIEPSTSSFGEQSYAAGSYQKEKKSQTPIKLWKVGDKCMAKWTDGQYYDATIEQIADDGEVSVMFEAYQNRSQTSVKELKEQKVRVEVFPSNNNKRVRPNQKEYLKKKKQKKQQRFQELEKEREEEKNKWLSFATKNAKKSTAKPKSIFASPDNVNGRVGIGTCGVAGKPMTDYQHRIAEKYTKKIHN